MINIKRLTQAISKLESDGLSFRLAAALRRDNSGLLWDVIVSAPDYDNDILGGVKVIAEALQQISTEKELCLISQVAVLEKTHPVLKELSKEISSRSPNKWPVEIHGTQALSDLGIDTVIVIRFNSKSLSSKSKRVNRKAQRESVHLA